MALCKFVYGLNYDPAEHKPFSIDLNFFWIGKLPNRCKYFGIIPKRTSAVSLCDYLCITIRIARHLYHDIYLEYIAAPLIAFSRELTYSNN